MNRGRIKQIIYQILFQKDFDYVDIKAYGGCYVSGNYFGHIYSAG